MSKNFSYNVTFRTDGKDTICELKNCPYIWGLYTEYTGIAHLHKGDKYDKKKGERIALLKARRKWHRAMYQILRKKESELNEKKNEVNKKRMEYAGRYVLDNEEIYKMVNE